MAELYLAIAYSGAAFLFFCLARIIRLNVGRMNWAAFTFAVIGSVMLMGAAVVWLELVIGSPALGVLVIFGFIAAGPVLLLRGESISAMGDAVPEGVSDRLPKKYRDFPSLMEEGESLHQVSWVGWWPPVILTDRRIIVYQSVSVPLDEIVVVRKTLESPWEIGWGGLLSHIVFWPFVPFMWPLIPWALLTRRLDLKYRNSGSYSTAILAVSRPSEWLTLIAELTPELTYFRGKVYR